MLLSLLIVVLLFAIAFFQATQGWFSALIMAVLTSCCATAALGGYEWVAINWLAPYWKPDYSYPIALAAVFGIPLIVLRVAADKLVRRSCLLPVTFDRIGGGVCGLVTGFITVGVFAHALQMIPFDGKILGYARVARISPDEPADSVPTGDKPMQERDLLLKPDRFALGVASLLSAGIFGNEQVLGYASPDIVQAIGWVGAVPAEVSRFAPPRSISVKQAATVPFVYKQTEANQRSGTEESFDAEPPKSGHEFLMLAVNISNQARDERRSIIFSLRQFRLVGRLDGKGAYQQYHGIALRLGDASQTVTRHVRSIVRNRPARLIVDDLFSPKDAGKGEVEVVFEVPERFVPEYLEYKHGAVATVPGRGDQPSHQAEQTPASTGQPAGPAVTEAAPSGTDDEDPPEQGSSRRRRRAPSADDETAENRGGNVRGVTSREGRSIFGDALPVPMKSYRKLKNAEIRAPKIVSGHLLGESDKQASGTDPEVRQFDVSPDKRLLQLNVSKLHTQSGLGGVLEAAAGTVQNYFVVDSNGTRYPMAGKLAIANVDGVKYMEVQYYSEPTGSMGGLGKFEKIRNSDLKEDYELILLFPVDPGAEIVSFQTGGSASRADDLRGENLIAPE